MKKFFNNAAILTFGFGLAMALTACHKGDSDEVPQPTPVQEVEAVQSRILVVQTNVAANVTYNGKSGSKSGNVYTFSNADQSGNLIVKPTNANYKSQELNIAFGDESSKYIDVTLYTAATNPEKKNVGATITVNNSNANQAETGVNAEISAPIDAVEGDGKDFSIVVFTPASGDAKADDLKKGDMVSEPVLAVDCEPDGVTFANAKPTVKVNIPGVNPFKLQMRHAKSGDVLTPTINGDDVTATIPHFSPWTYELVADVIEVEEETRTISVPDIVVNAGRNSVSYTRTLGYETNETATLINNYLKNLFGIKARNLKNSLTFTANQKSLAHFTVTQKVKKMTFKSDEKTFQATYFGVVSAKVSLTPSDKPATHNGGSSY